MNSLNDSICFPFFFNQEELILQNVCFAMGIKCYFKNSDFLYVIPCCEREVDEPLSLINTVQFSDILFRLDKTVFDMIDLYPVMN